jgi:hypothetical protein
LTAGVTVLRPVVAALAERIRNRPGLPPDGEQVLVDEVRAMRQELSELAERVDFTERLLAKGADAPRASLKEG